MIIPIENRYKRRHVSKPYSRYLLRVVLRQAWSKSRVLMERSSHD